MRVPLADIEIEKFPQEAATWAFAHTATLVQGSKPILVDLDGTLSDTTHRQHYLSSKPPDWAGFSLAARRDPANFAMISWLRDNYLDNPIIITSGRPSYAAWLTRLWVAEHGVRWDAIALRPRNDTVPGVSHKMRIVAVLRVLGFMPEFAFDDSGEVSLAYSEVGIRCFRNLQDPTMESHRQ
jgi:hypothetical protein